MLSAATGMRSTNSWIGIVPSLRLDKSFAQRAGDGILIRPVVSEAHLRFLHASVKVLPQGPHHQTLAARGASEMFQG